MTDCSGVAFAEEVSERVVVKTRQAMAVVNGLADYKESREREVVVANERCKLVETAAVDALFGPRELVASRNGGLWRI